MFGLYYFLSYYMIELIHYIALLILLFKYNKKIYWIFLKYEKNKP